MTYDNIFQTLVWLRQKNPKLYDHVIILIAPELLQIARTVKEDHAACFRSACEACIAIEALKEKFTLIHHGGTVFQSSYFGDFVPGDQPDRPSGA